jgi:hypothetical protein
MMRTFSASKTLELVAMPPAYQKMGDSVGRKIREPG